MDKADALELAADFLAECTECGSIHLLTPVPNAAGGRMSWADPNDGHLYYRRGSKSAENSLRSEAERLRGEFNG